MAIAASGTSIRKIGSSSAAEYPALATKTYADIATSMMQPAIICITEKFNDYYAC
jgi:hypothetical protein